jgi:hypothetical protein
MYFMFSTFSFYWSYLPSLCVLCVLASVYVLHNLLSLCALSSLCVLPYLSSLYALCALSSLNVVSDPTYLCVLCALYPLNIRRNVSSLCVLCTLYSLCVLCDFLLQYHYSVPQKLGSKQSIHFCRFEVALSLRGDVGLIIILKQGYMLHISNMQRKYASSENYLSRTHYLRILFHQQFVLHIWSTVSAHFHVHLSNLMAGHQLITTPSVTYRIIKRGKGKVHPCTGTEALYTPYGP